MEGVQPYPSAQEEPRWLPPMLDSVAYLLGFLNSPPLGALRTAKFRQLLHDGFRPLRQLIFSERALV